jgi:hypothetical protein
VSVPAYIRPRVNAKLHAKCCRCFEGDYSLRRGREGEQLGLHVDLTQARNAAGQLKKRLYTFEDAHMGEANFLFAVSLYKTRLLKSLTLMNSSFACSLSVSMVLVTLNMVLMMS